MFERFTQYSFESIEVEFAVKPRNRPELITAKLRIREHIGGAYKAPGHWQAYIPDGPSVLLLSGGREIRATNNSYEWLSKFPSLKHLTQLHVSHAIRDGRAAWRKYAEAEKFIELYHRFHVYRAIRKQADTASAFRTIAANAEKKLARALEVYNSGDVIKVITETKGEIWEEIFGQTF